MPQSVYWSVEQPLALCWCRLHTVVRTGLFDSQPGRFRMQLVVSGSFWLFLAVATVLSTHIEHVYLLSAECVDDCRGH